MDRSKAALLLVGGIAVGVFTSAMSLLVLQNAKVATTQAEGQGMAQQIEERLAQEAKDRLDKEIFERKLRCKTLADAYLKERAIQPGVFAMNIDFSPFRRSCIVAVRDVSNPRVEQYEVVDLLSRERIWSETCVVEYSEYVNWCGKGKNIVLGRQMAKEFETALISERNQ